MISLRLMAGLIGLQCFTGACGAREGTDGKTQPEHAGHRASNPAVMVAVAVQAPEGMNMYIGAYPELPAEADPASMMEVAGGQNASAFNGYIYSWSAESGTYTRFSVDEDYRLTKDEVVSFALLGGTGNIMTSFISATRAYSMTRDNLTIIAWDPTAMETLGTIDASAAIDPDYPDFDYGEPVLFGDYVAWPITWYNYDEFDFKPSVDVVLASASSNEPAIAVSDARCGSGWSLFTDKRGDLYALGNAWFGFAHFFDRDPSRQPNDCLLRINAGTTDFDPEFLLDLNRAADTPAVYHAWQSDDASVVAAVWNRDDDPADLPSPDDYWTAPMQRKLVRVDDEQSAPIEGIPKSAVFSTLNYRLDGELYMLMSEGSANSNQVRSSLYRITDTEAKLALTAAGDVWGIARVR